MRGSNSATALSSLVNANNNDSALRVEKARADFAFFCKHYLGHLFFKDFAVYQSELLRMVTGRSLPKESADVLRTFMNSNFVIKETSHVRGIVNVEPRGHGKTVRMCLALPLWCALLKRCRFILVIASNQTAAGRLRSDIAWEVTSNEHVLQDWGHMAGNTWSANELHFKNGACIRFAGAGTAIRGVRFRENRPDLILIDDLMTDGSAASPTQREKQYVWFKRAVVPMSQDALIVATGTVMHNDDIISRLSREICGGELPGWVNVRFSALRPHPRRKGVDVALWPEHWNVEALLRKKQEIGSRNFATEYQNQPLAPEDALVRAEWIDEHMISSIDSGGCTKIFVGVDPSAGKHDQSAIVVVGALPDGRVVVLDAWGKCCAPSTLISRLMHMYNMWRPVRVAFEAVGFQDVYKKYVEERARGEGVRLPIVAVHPRSGKYSRVEKMSPYFENGTYFFSASKGCAELKEQLTLFPMHQYDDQVDALFYAIELCSGSRAKRPAVFGIGDTRHVSRLFAGR